MFICYWNKKIPVQIVNPPVRVNPVSEPDNERHVPNDIRRETARQPPEKFFKKNKNLVQTRKKIPDNGNAQELRIISVHQNESTRNSPAQTLQPYPVKIRENLEQNTDQSPQANENSAKAISKPWIPC